MDAGKATWRRNFLVINGYIKKRKNTNKQPNFIPEGTRKRRTKFKFSKRKEITNIRAGETETRKTIAKTKETWEDTKSEIDITTDNTGTLRIIENYYE